MNTLLYWSGTKIVDFARWGSFPPDLLVIDLEESVAVHDRPAARNILLDQWNWLASYRSAVAVRICEASGPEAELDLLVIEHLPKNVGIVVPKPVAAASITRLPTDRSVWLMAEQSGIASYSSALCNAASVNGFIMGLKDMCETLGVAVDPNDLAYRYECSAVIDAAHRLSKPVFAGVLLGDNEAILKGFEEASNFGFDGVSLVSTRHLALLGKANDRPAAYKMQRSAIV